MNILRDGAALRRLSMLFNEGVTGAVTDGQLLERFATRSGEASEDAFAALVERHGPVVLRVCRSVLRDEHEAQDAFQATFLVLAQRAKSLCVRDSLGPWIHSVAYRVASCACAAAIRRRRHARRHGELAAGRLAVYQDEDQRDLEAVVHEEIDRLPEHFRTVLVLCDLAGCSHEQAARQLDWPVGTVKSRQARGRQRLRDRLIRRGLAPSPAMALGAARMPEMAVSPALMKSTANLATILRRGRVCPRRGPGQQGVDDHVPAKPQVESSVAFGDRAAGRRCRYAGVAGKSGHAEGGSGGSNHLGAGAGGRHETRAGWQDIHHGTTGTTRRPGAKPSDHLPADGRRPDDWSHDRHS